MLPIQVSTIQASGLPPFPPPPLPPSPIHIGVTDMSSRLDLCVVEPAASLSKTNHQMPFTPPQSSRSSFAKLPSRQLSSEPNESCSIDFDDDEIHVQYDVEAIETQSVYDDDLDDAMCAEDEVDDGRDHDAFVAARVRDSEQHDRLSSLRDPSPSGMLLFSADDPDFDTLDPSEAREFEVALIELSGPISSTLTQYRHQFNDWESTPNPHRSVIKASTLIDQCLAQFIYSLEPLRVIARDLTQLNQSLQELHSFLLGQPGSPFDLQKEVTCAQLWKGLCLLADQTSLVEDGLADASHDLNQLCDWVDGSLTPALAEVKLPSCEQNVQVSQILDVHSYLCESLAKACETLKIFLCCLNRISSSIARFQLILTSSPGASGHNDPPHLPPPESDSCPSDLPTDLLLRWAIRWNECLTSIIDSLNVLRSISECIQFSTSGGTFAYRSDIPTDAKPNLPPSHAILY